MDDDKKIAAKEKRGQERFLKVKNGAAEMEIWLKDLLRAGLLTLPERTSAFFDKIRNCIYSYSQCCQWFFDFKKSLIGTRIPIPAQTGNQIDFVLINHIFVIENVFVDVDFNYFTDN